MSILQFPNYFNFIYLSSHQTFADVIDDPFDNLKYLLLYVTQV